MWHMYFVCAPSRQLRLSSDNRNLRVPSVKAKTFSQKSFFSLWPYDLEQTSIWHQEFTIKNLFQKKPSEPIYLHYWITDFCILFSACTLNIVCLKKVFKFASPLISFTLSLSTVLLLVPALALSTFPQWGAVDAEIKVPSGENTELKRSPSIAWSRSAYSHTCYAYCQEFLPCLFLPFRAIHLHFFQNFPRFFPVLALANTGSCVGPQNKIGQPAWCGFPCWVLAEYK